MTLPPPAPNPGAPARTSRVQKRSVLKQLALACAASLVAVLACELGLRAWRAVNGNTYSASATRAEIEGLLDPLRDFVPAGSEQPDDASAGALIPILHPYTGAESWHDTGDVLKYFREHTSSDDYEIVLVGGSVAAYFGASASQRLIELLSADPHLAGRKITVLNYAHASYKQPQQLHRITYLLASGAKFDAVIDLDGFNEVALGLENAHTGTHPLYPSPPIWAIAAAKFGNGSRMRPEIVARMLGLRDEARATIERALRWNFSSSCILGTWTLQRLNGITRRKAELQKTLFAVDATNPANRRMTRQINGPVYSSDEAERMRMCVNAWFEGSISLDAECRARGILYLHVLQPALGDIGSKPLTDAEKAIVPPDADWMDGPRIGYPLLRERGQELALRGVGFLDASRAFADVEGTLYADPCHFDPAGNLILAEWIAPKFRALLATK
jgi:hypothetical protein